MLCVMSATTLNSAEACTREINIHRSRFTSVVSTLIQDNLFCNYALCAHARDVGWFTVLLWGPDTQLGFDIVVPQSPSLNPVTPTPISSSSAAAAAAPPKTGI